MFALWDLLVRVAIQLTYVKAKRKLLVEPIQCLCEVPSEGSMSDLTWDTAKDGIAVIVQATSHVAWKHAADVKNLMQTPAFHNRDTTLL